MVRCQNCNYLRFQVGLCGAANVYMGTCFLQAQEVSITFPRICESFSKKVNVSSLRRRRSDLLTNPKGL